MLKETTLEPKEILELVKNQKIDKSEALALFKMLHQSMDQPPLVEETAQGDLLETLYYRQVWKSSEIDVDRRPNPLGDVLILDFDETVRDGLQTQQAQASQQIILVMPGETFKQIDEETYEVNPSEFSGYQQLAQALAQTTVRLETIIHLWSREAFSPHKDQLEQQVYQSFYSAFFLSQALMTQKAHENVVMLYFYQSHAKEIQPQYAAVSGFVKTIRQENPLFSYKTVEVRSKRSPQPLNNLNRLLTIIANELHAFPQQDTIRYINDERFSKEIDICPMKPSEPVILKDNAVYLITGGARGLGLVVAEYLAQKYKARLALVGRSEPDASMQAIFQQLEKWGATVLYIQADIAQASAVRGLVTQVKSAFGKIDGVFHCAGLLYDAFIIKKTAQEIQAVLAPKIYGTVLLDEALKEEPLDLFVSFSSLAAMGHIGQSDYSYANSFLDHFSELREGWRAAGKRFGKSISINWPMWDAGGVGYQALRKTLPEDVFQAIRETGVEILSVPKGLDALEVSLSNDYHNCIILYGNAEKIEQTYLVKPPLPEHPPLPQERLSDAPATKELRPKVITFLTKILSEVSEIPTDQLSSDEYFKNYGINSLMVLRFNNSIGTTFRALPKMLLFEYKTIDELADYFMVNHQSTLVHLFGETVETEERPSAPAAEEPTPQKEDKPVGAVESTTDEGDIAIIGMSGRYPGAKNINQFCSLYRIAYLNSIASQ